MYCLKVVIAHPDYKRPYAEVIVEHFGTEAEAKGRLSELKNEYIDAFEVEVGDRLATEEELDAMARDGRLAEYIYGDAYMSQEPMEWEIFEVVL
jgi:hypothetical protein